MGIYDRDYYRRERSSFFSAFGSTGRVVNTLIVITVVAFIVQMLTRESLAPGKYGPSPFTLWFEFSTREILSGQVWRLLTYAFLHDPNYILHIIFNMLLLWMLGREMEDIYGPKEFLAFYLVAAVCGGMGQLAAELIGLTRPAPMYGASGAVTAVMVLFAMHYPRRIFYLFFVIPVPALVLVVLFVVVDAFGLLGGSNGRVAVACHLGGAAFGFLYYKFQWRVLRFWPSMPRWRSIVRRQPKLRVYRGETEEPVAVHAGPRSTAETDLEAELDAVLAKVSRHGQGSLDEREQKILQRASEIYRNKRK